MSNLAAKPAFEYTLIVLSGPDKGTIYKLRSRQITIGRDPSNHIVVHSDNKCSRRHAVIEFSESGVRIVVASDKARILLNDAEVVETALAHGTKFKIGRTKFQFRVVNNAMSPQALARHQGQVPGFGRPENIGAPATQGPQGGRQPLHKKSNKNFYYMIGGVVLLLMWLLASPQKDEDEEIKIRMKTAREAELEKQMKDLEVAQKERPTEDQTDAKEYWIKGFRDFRKGMFETAIISFSTCRALNPGNSKCLIYERKAQRKLDELVQYHMRQGTQYREKNQFRACASSFKNVMNIVKDRNDLEFKEAAANFLFCSERLREQY